MKQIVAHTLAAAAIAFGASMILIPGVARAENVDRDPVMQINPGFREVRTLKVIATTRVSYRMSVVEYNTGAMQGVRNCRRGSMTLCLDQTGSVSLEDGSVVEFARWSHRHN